VLPANLRFQPGIEIASRLEEAEPLLGLYDLALPMVGTLNRAENLRAGRQPLLDAFPGQTPGHEQLVGGRNDLEERRACGTASLAGSRSWHDHGREVQSPEFKVQTKESIPNDKLRDARSTWFIGLNFGVGLSFGL
jgi:hypothetical protein